MEDLLKSLGWSPDNIKNIHSGCIALMSNNTTMAVIIKYSEDWFSVCEDDFSGLKEEISYCVKDCENYADVLFTLITDGYSCSLYAVDTTTSKERQLLWVFRKIYSGDITNIHKYLSYNAIEDPWKLIQVYWHEYCFPKLKSIWGKYSAGKIRLNGVAYHLYNSIFRSLGWCVRYDKICKRIDFGDTFNYVMRGERELLFLSSDMVFRDNDELCFAGFIRFPANIVFVESIPDHITPDMFVDTDGLSPSKSIAEGYMPILAIDDPMLTAVTDGFDWEIGLASNNGYERLCRLSHEDDSIHLLRLFHAASLGKGFENAVDVFRSSAGCKMG